MKNYTSVIIFLSILLLVNYAYGQQTIQLKISDKITAKAALKLIEHSDDSLSQSGLQIIQIEGANHFFDYEYEFELLSSIEFALHKT